MFQMEENSSENIQLEYSTHPISSFDRIINNNNNTKQIFKMYNINCNSNRMCILCIANILFMGTSWPQYRKISQCVWVGCECNSSRFIETSAAILDIRYSHKLYLPIDPFMKKWTLSLWCLQSYPPLLLWLWGVEAQNEFKWTKSEV